MEQKDNFMSEFNELISIKRNDNSAYLSNEKYNEILNCIKNAQVNDKKTALMYRRLKRFDVLKTGNDEKLITPVAEGSTKFVFYVKNEEMYDILHNTHLKIGHGGKHKMFAEVKKKYKNVSQEVIKMYLKYCEPCQTRMKSKKKGLPVKPLVISAINNLVNSRCQVDIIDMQSQPDRSYRYIMIYQDHLTKFIQLRPLTSKRAEEVARHIVDIFCIFGAPCVIQSDNGREFINQIVDRLKVLWPNLKIVHGNSRHSQNQGSVGRVNQDIKNLLINWMQTEKNNKWSEGLGFVQLMKNKAHHDGIQQSPYQAMFGCDMKIGLATSLIPNETINVLKTEEDLEELLNNVKTASTQGDNNFQLG